MTIGSTLAAARRQAGLSIAEVSQRTRIRETIIGAIEHDDYAPCGGDFYARGHIRAIAKVVGADPGPLIEEYDTVVSPPDWIWSDDVLEPAKPPTHRRRRRAARSGGEGLPPAAKPADPAEPHQQRMRDWAAPLGVGDLLGSSQPTSPIHPERPAGPRKRRRTALIGIGLVAALGLAGYALAGGPAQPPHVPPAAAPSVTVHRHTSAPPSPGAASPHALASARASTAAPAPPPSFAPSSPSSPPPAAPAPASQTLRPAGASAFGAAGPGGGDNPQLAPLAIDGNPSTAWHTDWYTSASFGNLYAGTGLLVDLGRPVTVSSVRLALGSAVGGRFQLRVGDSPTLSGLRTVARVSGSGGVVHVHLAIPANGRYVLIWFTTLPTDSAGTYEASVYDVRLRGQE